MLSKQTQKESRACIFFPKIFFFFSLIFLTLTFFSHSHPASALSTGGVGGYPASPDPSIQFSESWFIYTLDIGESKDDAIIIFNTTDEIQTVKLYAVDSVPSNQGNFALEKEDDPKEGIGAWIELFEYVITLDPGESREVPFVITIPESADVGEHSGGIIIQKTQIGEVAESGASIVTRVGIRVYETVPGEIIKKIDIGDFSVKRIIPDDAATKPYFQIDLSVKNNGNVSLKPFSEILITGWGKEDYEDIKEMNYESIARLFRNGEIPLSFFSDQVLSKEWQLLKGQNVTTNWTWPEPVFGHFTFQARLTYESTTGKETILSQPISVWVIPWFELGVIGGVFVLLAVFQIFYKMFFLSTRGWQKYQVQAGDNLPKIAHESGKSLKRIAKVNKIRQPYIIKPGQTIVIPSNYISKKTMSDYSVKSSDKIIRQDKKRKGK